MQQLQQQEQVHQQLQQIVEEEEEKVLQQLQQDEKEEEEERTGEVQLVAAAPSGVEVQTLPAVSNRKQRLSALRGVFRVASRMSVLVLPSCMRSPHLVTSLQL